MEKFVYAIKRYARLIESITSLHWILLICFGVLSLPLAVRTIHSVKQADSWASVEVYQRVDFWIQSSECAAKTGAILAICSSTGKITGIEDVGLADDRGHTLIANLYSKLTGRAISRKGLVILNIALNSLTFFALTFAFFIYGWKATALLLLLLGSRIAVPGPLPSPDAPAAYSAAFCLSIISVLWVAHFPLDKAKNLNFHFVAGLLIAMFCIAWATLLRQPYGVGGLLVVVLILAIRVLVLGRHHGSNMAVTLSWRFTVVAICLSLATLYSTTALIKIREIVYGVPRGEKILQHGISHNLYLGLGVKNNPWGIKWDDIYGYESATQLGKAEYASEEHYGNLRRLYLSIVISNPIVVMKIYAGKFWDSLLISVDNDKGKLIKASVAVFLALIILIWLRRFVGWDEKIALFAIWAGFGAVMLQGVLALPWVGFISPGKLSALCGIIVLVETAGRAVLMRLKND